MGKTPQFQDFSIKDPNHAKRKKTKELFFSSLSLSLFLSKLNHRINMMDIIYETQVRQTPNEKEKAGSSISSSSVFYSTARGTDSA